MYELNSFAIFGILLATMVLASQVGRNIGEKITRNNGSSDYFTTHVNGIQASLLGVMALLLGFTFSLALQRYESRSEAVVSEANAIGTALLRAQLLPEPLKDEVLPLMKRYLDLRVEAGGVSLRYGAERELLLQASDEVLRSLWQRAEVLAAIDGSPVRSGLFIQALNDMIDNFGYRDAELRRHVPELVLFLLYATFLLTAGVLGYAAGIARHRLSFVTYILILLIDVLVFVIIDIDHPRSGYIKVDQSSMLNLQRSVEGPPAT